MIKTLHLTNHFHEQSGGIATFYRALMQAAEAQGRPIRLIVPSEHDRIEPVGNHGIIYHLRAPRAPLNNNYRVLYPTQFLRSGTRIQAILRDERPDVIEVCDKYNLSYLAGLMRLNLLPELNFRPLILGLSCERMDENVAAYLSANPVTRAFCRWYMHWIYFPFFDHHIANSAHTAVELAAAAAAHAVSRSVFVRPMGVDTQGLSPRHRATTLRNQLLQQASGTAESTLLLYTGRLVPEKNLPLLIETLAKLDSLAATEAQREEARDFRLIIAGEGIARPHLEELAAKLIPNRVAFLGHIADRAYLAALYASADIFLHPNPREPFGIAPLEAMASGLPLVAPNEGGITSFANDTNAWLVPPTASAFATAIHSVLNNQYLREQRIRAALTTAGEYNWPPIAANYLTLYDQLHNAFQTSQPVHHCNPYFQSSPATKSSSAGITAFSTLAKAAFATYLKWKSPTP